MTSPKYGVADATAYKSWLAARLSAYAPTIVVPCHGPPVKSRRLADEIEQLVHAKI